MFYVPYSMIEQFSAKKGGEYRHTLSHRIYLYLLFCKSGRMKYSNRKELVSYFNSSHTAVGKAIAHLVESGLGDLKKGYISAIGRKRFEKNINFSKLNTRILFKESDIQDSSQFKKRIFLSLGQGCAMAYGRTIAKPDSSNNIPYCDSVTLKGGIDPINLGLVQSTVKKPEYIQDQASVYLAKFMDRHPMTVYRRMRKVRTEKVFYGNEEFDFRKNGCTALTVNGFNTKESSALVHFHESPPAYKRLEELKVNDPSTFNTCFVKEANHGGYAIVKPYPNTYTYGIETKAIFKNLDNKYKK